MQPERVLWRPIEAALAQPEPEVAGPSDEELYALWNDCDLGWDEQKGMVVMPHIADFARAVLSRFGRPAPAPAGEVVALARRLRMYCTPPNGPLSNDPDARWLARAADLLEQRQAAPVPAGEVEELVAELRMMASQAAEACQFTDAENLSSAADQLEQRHPAPVPVSERPWERDGWCDEDGRCWWFNPEDPHWVFDDATCRHWAAFSLPHNALPLPQGEVEA